MSDPINSVISPQINIRIVRCYQCGRFWGLETGQDGTCPKCAQDRLDVADTEQKRLGRVIISLRGAVTRGKKKS